MYARRACKMMTQNITNFTRKEPVRIRARKEDTKLNAPSSRSQRQSIIQSSPSLYDPMYGRFLRSRRTMGTKRTTEPNF